MNDIMVAEIFEKANVAFNADEWTPEEQAALGLYFKFVQNLAKNGCPKEAIQAMALSFYTEDGYPITNFTPEFMEKPFAALLENGCPEEALYKAMELMYSGIKKENEK